MTILSGIPIIHCLKIEDTLAFYQQLLQFVVVNKRDENGALTWVHIMHGETTLMLQTAVPQGLKTSSDKTPATENSKISLFFFVNSINDLHHFIKAKHENVSELNQTAYQMQEFSMLDPEGNTVTVGMSLKQKN